jgi:cytosine deaminase
VGLENAGMIRAGGPADAIIFEATGWTDLFSRTNTARTVLRNGKPLGIETAEAAGIERRRA